MYNHYFDRDGVYTMSTHAYPETTPSPDCIRTGDKLAIPPHYWPVVNSDKSGFDMMEDHRGKSGYVDGRHIKIAALGPLPEGWSDEPPESPIVQIDNPAQG